MLGAIDSKGWIERLAQTVRRIYRQLHPTDNFVDKTPGWPMLKALPALLVVWPNLRVVFTKRRGIENVLSRQRKFPDGVFESHCRDWAAAMETWLAVHAEIPQE